jgi:molybdenum cofactor guanylyltransferase
MTFSAVLLAGGESRRMGRDKATLEFQGRLLWEHQLELLRALRPEQIFVSARTTPAWLPNDVGLLLDDPPSHGPLSGLTKALTTMGTSHLLALGVDMPFMTVDEFRRLLELATDGRGVVPIIGDRAEPLAAFYPAEAAGDFQRALGGSDFSLQAIVRNLAAAGRVMLRTVADADMKFYRSLNAPGDHQEFVA